MCVCGRWGGRGRGNDRKLYNYFDHELGNSAHEKWVT